jgi:hypothetical protein
MHTDFSELKNSPPRPQKFKAEQVRLAKDLAIGIARRDTQASAGPLLLSLRDELREHSGLQALGEKPLHFRLKVGTESRDKYEDSLQSLIPVRTQSSFAAFTAHSG